MMKKSRYIAGTLGATLAAALSQGVVEPVASAHAATTQSGVLQPSEAILAQLQERRDALAQAAQQQFERRQYQFNRQIQKQQLDRPLPGNRDPVGKDVFAQFPDKFTQDRPGPFSRFGHSDIRQRPQINPQLQQRQNLQQKMQPRSSLEPNSVVEIFERHRPV